jgi:hypothetical protein
MIASTTDRVPCNTAERVNERIRERCLERVARCARQGRGAIDQRLRELDAEWDIERMLETMAPTFSLLGLGLGLTVHKKWLLIPAAVNAFFLQHAIQGWCPPLPILRRLGFRTMREIDSERFALKTLRGDFRNVPTESEHRPLDVSQALAAVDG